MLLKVCASESVSLSVLAFKGAPLLAHVSMRLCALLSLFVVTPGPTPHERPLTDL